MDKKNKHLKKLFAGGLKKYMAEESEENLTEAYELGRQSLQEGFSKLDIIALYHEIIFDTEEFALQEESKKQMELASEYLTEYLAPFEVRLQSYQDLIDNLNKKNEQLEKEIENRKEREQKLRDYSERLKNLSARIERTREEERKKIAKDIHDELGQMLTVLKMDVSMLSTNMKDRVSGDTFDFFSGKTEEIRERISAIIKSIQRITTELRPEVLDTMGLKEAIDWKSNEVENRTGIDIVFTTNVEQKRLLENKRASTFFRIFQETLTNVIRHAMASKVEVELKRDDPHLYLIVRDNGIGVEQRQLDSTTSVGLIGMRERAQFLGGKLDIVGEEGKGTTIILRIPLEESTA